MDRAEASSRLLDAASTLFYQRGVQAVGMDDIRAASGVSLKRLYECFESKDQLVLAYLWRRDRWWRGSLADFVERRDGADGRLAAVFDWLHDWFSQPTFRGCAFINSYGELGAVSPDVVEVVRFHKDAFKSYLAGLLSDGAVPDPVTVAEQLTLVIEGAIVSAAISGNPDAALHARSAADALVTAARTANQQHGVNTPD